MEFFNALQLLIILIWFRVENRNLYKKKQQYSQNLNKHVHFLSGQTTQDRRDLFMMLYKI